jgi:hypothetical protein
LRIFSGRWGCTLLSIFICGSATAASTQILHYEPLRAESRTVATASQKHTGKFPYAFEAFGRRFAITLTRNERITFAKPLVEEGPTLSLYQGAIDGLDGSWVRLAAQGERVHGMVWDGEELYVIEPVDVAREEVVAPADMPASGSIVFRVSDTRVTTPATCAAEAPLDAEEVINGLAQYKAMVAELKDASAAIVATNPNFRIELGVIGDSLYRRSYESSDQARHDLLIRMNFVDGIFASQVGIAIQVPTVVLEDTTGSVFSSTTSSNTLLQELAAYRKSSAQLRARGLTHLFTGRNLDGDTVGIAYIGTVCDASDGVGLTQTYGLSLWMESLIAAHEIGHNFGAYHDGEDQPGNKPGECPTTPSDGYLMAARMDESHQEFSACSRDTIRSAVPSAWCVAPIATADFAVAAELPPVRALVATPFEWTFDVGNVGTATATAAIARAHVPPLFTVMDAWATTGACRILQSIVECDLGDVAPNTMHTVSVYLRGDTEGSSVGSVYVLASNDAGMNNNLGQGRIDLETGVDLAVELLAGAASIGTDASSSVTVRNLSDRSAQEVTINVTASAGLAVKDVALAGAGCTSLVNGVRCSLGTLDAGAALTGPVTFNASTAGPHVLTAQVASIHLDSNVANNTAQASVPVSAATVTANPAESSGGGAFGLELLLLGLLELVRRLRSRQRTG